MNMLADMPSTVSRRFVALEIDHSADQHCAVNVGHDQPHAPSHVFISKAIVLMPKESDHCCACCRFINDRSDTITEPLRLGPFPVDTGFREAPDRA
jgi:hypothetical protein